MKWKLAVVLFGGFIGALFYFFSNTIGNEYYTSQIDDVNDSAVLGISTSTKNIPVTSSIPGAKTLSGFSWVGQTFNNCSSVATMIVLSYWGVTDTQEAIAEATRPWNNRNGNNDDKSVTLYELADYVKNHHAMSVYVRPNGDIELLKKFIANGVPVLARTLMYPQDDIVHYRVVRGYDDTKKIIIETDGVYGKSYKYTYDEWMYLWKDFNYEYLIIVPKEKEALVVSILGEQADEAYAWQQAKERAIREYKEDSSHTWAKYNEITARYYLKEYSGVITEFEKIKDMLTRRKLWYQMEPIESYFVLKQYDKVVELADKIINDNNKSVSELYVMKGKIYESKGDTVSAQREYEKAVFYNKNLKSAQDSLTSLTKNL